MTTETSNARGDLLRPKLENIISGHRINADDADWLRGLLAAAPPPAAARGDVRGLVGDRQAWFESEIAKAERQWIDGFHDRYEAGDDVPSMDHFVALWLAERTEALAAEGVQAGEVEQRARELLAQHEQQDKTGGAPVVRRDDALRAIASALSQQPEARGVDVDALRDARTIYDIACIRERQDNATREDVEFKAICLRNYNRIAALTGERNG